MERIRKSFQGVINIVRFNWHFYILSLGAIFLMLIFERYLNKQYSFYINFLCILIMATTLISLIVSFYVYDLSNLYKLNWLDNINLEPNNKIININAGFDETSSLLQSKYIDCELQAYDFYDPKKHTEVSIKRAREAYPAYKNTLQINTSNLPLQSNDVDNIFVILSAHEIRNDIERIIFFKELNRVLKDAGKVIVIEHLRDLPNFLAYNIGFFHFISKSNWINTFKNADFNILKEIKITSFITTFVLIKNGNTP